MKAGVWLVLLAAALPLHVAAQVGTEPAQPRAAGSMYPAEWPAGPGPDSVPGWAQPGRLSFARWDGGPIETAKAFLSGWPGFNPVDPDSAYVMTNWYHPRTIRLLREGGVRMVWVTFSNGFSIPSERFQQEQLRLYIQECHRQGIRVMAYQSIANMFWEDMFEHVPESRDWPALGRDGKPVPYGAAAYSPMGRVTRYMASLEKRGWRDYLKKRVDLAIDAGVDGIMYDNNFGAHLFDTYSEIYQYASSRKRDLLLMGNFHTNTYVFNRLVNCITTEDGREPGIYADGRLVNNIGLFRVHSTLSGGWKPVMIEDGGRETGERLTTPMSGARHRLALAEAMMFNIAMELFVEGGFARRLWHEEPGAMAIWRAIGAYNRFFADHQQFYAGARPLAGVAVVLDDRSQGIDLLNGLAGRGLAFDVIYEHDLTAEALKRYRAVAVLTAETIRERALRALNAYAAGGGRLFLSGKAGRVDEMGHPRAGTVFPACAQPKSGCTVYGEAPPAAELAASLASAARAPEVRVEAPAGVLHNLTQLPDGRRVLHLLNYAARPAGAVKLSATGRWSAFLLSPDESRKPLQVSGTAAATTMEVPEIETYSLVILTAGRATAPSRSRLSTSAPASGMRGSLRPASPTPTSVAAR